MKQALIILILLLIAVAIFTNYTNKQGYFEEFGENADNVIQDASDTIEDAGDKLKKNVNEANNKNKDD